MRQSLMRKTRAEQQPALGAIKNPRHNVFAGQANISNGPQQVNNMVSKRDAQERDQHHDFQKNSESEQNELLNRHDEGNRMDAGTACKAGGSDQGMEALGAVNWPKNRVRQGMRLKEHL